MDRIGKGNPINDYLKDYCVVDLETTGICLSSLEIIEISALKIRDGVVVAEYSQLVNPQCPIPVAASKVNHITDDMVENAPIFDEVVDDFLSFVEKDVILGWNNACFDNNILYDKILLARGIYFDNDYIDALLLARKAPAEMENHKLETVCKYYNLDTSGEHRALKDCYLTFECYKKMYEQFGDSLFKNIF